MNHSFEYEAVEPESLNWLREMQCNDLKGPVQEYNEEGIITYGADFIKIARNGETAGYACIGTHEQFKDVILEFYLLYKFRSNAGEVLTQLAAHYGCKQWAVNTQDFFSLPMLLDLGLPYELDAYLFSADPSRISTVDFGQGVSFEVTERDELQEIYAFIMQDGFYSGGGIESVEALLAENELYSLRLDNTLIGVGFVSKLKRTPAYADIAMIIDRNERHKGWGTRIVMALMQQCRLRNMIPAAVCAADNLNSRRTLEKAGFHVTGCILMAKLNHQPH